MIKVPAFTTERRQELTKIVHKEAEESKVAIRNLRHDARNELEKQFKAKEISENEKDATEKNIDETTKKYNEKIEELALHMTSSSLCALGQTASNPVLSTIKYFRDEYVAHIEDKSCPSKVCKDLIVYEIDPAKCRGCTKCARLCPVGAISGSPKQMHLIDREKCIKCGLCMRNCNFDAVYTR